MKVGAPGSFGAQLKALRETAGFTQEELATIAGLSVHAVSALERGERRRPHVETVRALSAALDLTGPARDALLGSARAPANEAAIDELSGVSLPLALTVLLGRESDVQILRQWLADPAVRLITLVGPGGVGKTRLALELARAVAEEGWSRVLFVSLASTRDPAFVASTIAEALGLADVSALNLAQRARAACDGRSTLVMLDNFEQVLAAAPLVADLLASVAALRLLVTSRAPLRVRGEREYVVGPLELEAGSETMSPADLARTPAVRLFLELESYRSVLAWLIERGRPAEASDIAWGLKYFWLIRGHAAEGLQWYEQILNLPFLPPSAELRALVGAAVLWYTQGELGRAGTGLNRALALAHGAGDRDVVMQAEYLSGHVEHAAGNLDAARDRFTHSVEGFRALAIPSGTGNALSGMAAIALATGDTGQAERLLDEATSVLRHARGS
jgi:transcriptional regulator with XRE-family HTH domain